MSLHEFFHEIILHSLIDTCKIIPFLLLTYVIVEILEHKPILTVSNVVHKMGRVGPLIGSVVGCIPQCGFSATAANFFGSGLITIGTLVSVFLSTSDEMIPILLGSSINNVTVFNIIIYKVIVSVFFGFLLDIATRQLKFNHPVQIDGFCEQNNCDCHESHSLIKSVLKHTFSVSVVVLFATVSINAIIHLVGHETITTIISNNSFLSYIISSVFGLLPNCSASVILSSLYTEGIISLGTMLSGLLTGSGVGTLVLLKVHKHKYENAFIITWLIFVGIVAGMLADTQLISSLILK